MTKPLSVSVARRLSKAARRLSTADPTRVLGPLLEKTFSLPAGDPRYAANALVPGAAPLEPSFSELEPGILRFTVEPLEPSAGAIDRRDEATREMRRLVRDFFGRDALHWFDGQSEEWRIKIAGPKGEKVAAEMVAAMYDASLDAFRPHAWTFPANSVTVLRLKLQ